jgi:hypothetical protein
MLLEEITDDVATTPFTVVVKVLPLKVVVRELIMLAKSVETPFTILANVLVVVESILVFTAVVVAITPFTLLVITLAKLSKPLLFMMLNVVVAGVPFVVFTRVMALVVLEFVSKFVVVAAISEARDEVDITPFTLVVMIPVDVANDTELFDMTELVATTPFTVVVSVLTLSVVVREFIMLVNNVVTPFIIEAKVFVVVDRVFVFIIVVVPIDPAIFEVNTFALLDSEFVAFKFATDKLVAVTLEANTLVAFTAEAVTVLNIGLAVKE